MTKDECIEMLQILLDNAKIGCADITVIHHVSFDSFKFVIEQVIKTLEQEPCEDDVIITYDTYHDLIADRAEKLEQESQKKRCEDCNHYGKISLYCGRCDDDCSMFEPKK